MPDPIATSLTIKTKRTRKASTPRVRKPKDPAILAIEKDAADLKAKYRAAQSSGGVLNRIQMLIPRLTPKHRQALYDDLSKMETPKLLDVPDPVTKITDFAAVQ